jgi:hypothetical protein
LNSVLSVISLLVGILVTLIGLVGMGPQVNVHRIRPWSVAAWVFRVGGLLMIIGLLLSLTSGLERELIRVSLILGTACVIACAVIVHHEWVQAGEQAQSDFRLQHSPLLIALWLGSMALGAVVIIGLATNMMIPTLNWLILFELLISFGLLAGIQSSSERQRANFILIQSFSLQAYIVGVIVIVLGLILLIKS